MLGKGSICGVNLTRFIPNELTRSSVRREVNIKEGQLVFVFMGRLNHDKGLYELLPAFDKLAQSNKNVFLLLFGADEEGVASRFADYKFLDEGNFLYYGPTREPYRMLQAGDVFVLPTYREGFGSSVIEASALGLPVICSDAYGVKDAMVDNVTGLRCRVGDVESLYEAMNVFVQNPSFIKIMGLAGRKRVIEDFDGEQMTKHWVDYYLELLPVR